MKRENNKKFKKRKRNQNRSLTCRVLSMMFAIVLFCSTVLINTDYVSQASSFDDMVDMVEVEEDSAAADTSEDTGDDLDTDVNFESESEEGSAETYSESDDFGSSDADFSSGENMFTDGTSESSAPAEEAAQPVSCIVNLKNETIEVKAEAPAGVLPNGTQMIVKAVENNTEDAELTDQYNKLAAKITEQLQSQGKNLDGFLAYNVSFTDADGNPVEPSDKVTYSFTYKEASSPELTDPAASTVTAAMIRTNKETSELELTELKAEEDKLTVETNESRQLTKAAFQSAATAAYTFVWSSTPVADDNENNENKEENGEVNNEEVNTDTNTENTEENGEDTNTENNVENSEEEQNPEEAPDQEQIKMIRVIADEVNLRVTPSTEAEVIATVDTDTQLPLIETVTGEDEFTWYKVSYEEAQAYVRSDMAEVVETEEQGTENEDSNAELTKKANLYSENGITLYASGQSTVNLTNIDILYTTSANDIIPTSVKDSDKRRSGNNYTYERTVVGIGEESVEVKALRRESSSSNSPIQYSEDGENWMDVGSNPVKFIYTADAKGEVPKTIKTADTRNLINISMANYRENQNYYNSFQFGSADYTGSEAVRQNLVQGVLKDGYPVLNNGTSLNGLFDGTWGEVIQNTYVTGLNHLFSYDSSTGTYSYDSDENYAYYDIDSSRNTEKNFIVYERSKYKGEGMRHVASFMPYSSWDDGASQNKFAFGMMISFEFLQPKNGKINGQDMVFSFSGDDDVWVFIDNKLVLDLGGVHERATGSINFANGEVYVNNQSNPTLRSVFNSDSDTFADYTSHSLKLFYMERGRGDSNCSIKFNLPPRPTNSIEIVKSLANSDKEKYTSTDFQFKAYLEDEEDRNQEPVQYNAIPEGTPYRVKKNDSLTDEVRYVGKHNIFTLKAGESAVFEGIDSGLRFYAEEVGILSDQFDKVDITDWKVTYHDLNGNLVGTSEGKVPEQTKTYLARSGVKTAGNAARVEFKNTCNVNNLRKLRITKKMNGLSTTDKFSFQVYLTGQNRQFIPYDGGYEVIHKDGTSVSREGNPQGIIRDVAPDETIVIDQILSGTEFKVNEIELDNSRYEKPIKEVKKGLCDDGTVTDSDGKIALKKDAHVIITNTLKVDLTVNKEWSDKNIKHSSIYAGLYKADGTPLKCVELNEDNQYRYVFGNVSSSDLVYELRPVTGNENAEFTINNNGYVKVEADKIIVAKANNTDTKYKVSYKKEVSEDGTKITQTITNTKIVTKLNLIKVEKNNEKNLLKNAEFALYTANDNYTYEESNRVTGNIKTDSNGRATVNGLVPGKYVLKETKAPEGYSLSANVWQVLVRDNQSVEVTLNGVPVEKSDDGAFVIENIKLYSLPSTGGSGIYWYMIGGMVLMSAAAWILYKNKCREVLGK